MVLPPTDKPETFKIDFHVQICTVNIDFKTTEYHAEKQTFSISTIIGLRDLLIRTCVSHNECNRFYSAGQQAYLSK